MEATHWTVEGLGRYEVCDLSGQWQHRHRDDEPRHYDKVRCAEQQRYCCIGQRARNRRVWPRHLRHLRHRDGVVHGATGVTGIASGALDSVGVAGFGNSNGKGFAGKFKGNVDITGTLTLMEVNSLKLTT